jgi:hypothetical protein
MKNFKLIVCSNYFLRQLLIRKLALRLSLSASVKKGVSLICYLQSKLKRSVMPGGRAPRKTPAPLHHTARFEQTEGHQGQGSKGRRAFEVPAYQSKGLRFSAMSNEIFCVSPLNRRMHLFKRIRAETEMRSRAALRF